MDPSPVMSHDPSLTQVALVTGIPCCSRGETWSVCCPHLSTIIARGTIGTTGTSRTWRTLHTTLTRETSLALEGKEGRRMTAVPETGPSFSFSMGAAKGSTYSCTRGARGTEVSRNTLKGREGQTVSKVHLGPPHWKALPSSSWGPALEVCG